RSRVICSGMVYPPLFLVGGGEGGGGQRRAAARGDRRGAGRAVAGQVQVERQTDVVAAAHAGRHQAAVVVGISLLRAVAGGGQEGVDDQHLEGGKFAHSAAAHDVHELCVELLADTQRVGVEVHLRHRGADFGIGAAEDVGGLLNIHVVLDARILDAAALQLP